MILNSSCRPGEMHLGLPNNMVLLVPYSSEWPLLFSKEESRIAAALRGMCYKIEHIGSTAVPGLQAKPVVDIMVGVSDVEQMILAEAEMVSIGYEAKGEKGVPGRLFLTCGDPCMYHVHITELNGPFWQEHILFRDQLRQTECLATNYVEIKMRLANAYPTDRDSYTRGKAGFIEQVIAAARQETSAPR